MKTKKTYIVLGCPRSGTSMVAGLLRILGIDMGDNIKQGKHEDTDILWKEIGDVEKKIDDYNSRKEIWGFKDPNFADKLSHLKDKFINPKYIAIFRHNNQSIESDIRRNPKMNRRTAIRRNRRQIKKINTLIRELDNNYIKFQYEDFINNPKENIIKLINFVGADMDKLNKCERFIKPGNYNIINE